MGHNRLDTLAALGFAIASLFFYFYFIFIFLLLSPLLLIYNAHHTIYTALCSVKAVTVLGSRITPRPTHATDIM